MGGRWASPRNAGIRVDMMTTSISPLTLRATEAALGLLTYCSFKLPRRDLRDLQMSHAVMTPAEVLYLPAQSVQTARPGSQRWLRGLSTCRQVASRLSLSSAVDHCVMAVSIHIHKSVFMKYRIPASIKLIMTFNLRLRVHHQKTECPGEEEPPAWGAPAAQISQRAPSLQII